MAVAAVAQRRGGVLVARAVAERRRLYATRPTPLLDLLGLPAATPRERVRDEYVRAALATHPDHSDDPEAAAQMMELHTAWRAYSKTVDVDDNPFTAFGVGCSFDDSEAERRARRTLQDLAARGIISPPQALAQTSVAPRLEWAIGCVVTAPWSPQSAEAMGERPTALRALLNPANEALVGTARPYFPRGGPLPPRPPPALSASSFGWGGMDAGSNMLYPAQAVDGLVHRYGGRQLRESLRRLPVLEARPNGEHVRCRVGDVVATAAPEPLPFDTILHAPPPFWPQAAPADGRCGGRAEAWRTELSSLYTAAVRVAAADAVAKGREELLLATPLVGSGACGAPVTAAAAVLVRSIAGLEAAAELPLPVRVRAVVVDDGSGRALQRAIDDHAEETDTNIY